MGSEPEGRGGEADDGTESWEEPVLDEEFIRSAEVSEPAARTRMLRERWRDRPPEPQPWRADGPPTGWLFSKSRRNRKRRRDED